VSDYVSESVGPVAGYS